MELCDVCGSFLVIGDTQCRVDAHLLGKQHIGFARIRAAISELRVSRFMLPDFILCVCLYWCQYFCMHYAHTEPLAFSFCWLMHCKVTNTRLDPQVSPLFRQWREWFGACRLSMSSRLAFENWAEILCCMYVYMLVHYKGRQCTRYSCCMCSGMHASAFKLVQQPCRSPLIKGHPLRSYSEMEYAHPPSQRYTTVHVYAGVAPYPSHTAWVWGFHFGSTPTY